MASRAVWKGQIRLSLVSIPVELHSATKSGARVSFRQIHGPSGQRVRYLKTVPGIGPVKNEDILKGYELDDDEYLLLEPEEIDEIKLETRKTLELVQFVGGCEIPPLYFDRPYYVLPSDELAEDAYRVVRDALRKADKVVGLGQLTMRGKEYLCALKPCNDGLLLETLKYADELRQAEPMFSEIKDETADEDLLGVATQLIERKTAPFEAEAFRDRYDQALRELLEAKRKSRKTPRTTAEEGAKAAGGGENVVDLMDALKASLKESGGKSGGGRKSPKSQSSSARSKSASSKSGASDKSSSRGKKSA